MAIAGTLAVNILARTDKFNKGISSARKSLKGFDKSTKQTSRSLSVLSRSLLAIIGPAIMGRMIVSTAKASNELENMSRRLGFNIEQLQFWQFASQRAGIEQRTLTMAIQRMERRLGEAAKGMGEAQGALKDLNIDAAEFVKLQPHKQFEQIIEATRGITNQNEQLRVFFKLFDSEGVSLVQLLGENVGELREQFEQLGGATSKEGISQATKFVNAMTNLKQTSGKLLETFTITISPAAEKAMNFLIGRFEGFRANEKAIAEMLSETPSIEQGIAFGLGGKERVDAMRKRQRLLDRPSLPMTPRQRAARLPQPTTQSGKFGEISRGLLQSLEGPQLTASPQELIRIGRRMRARARNGGRPLPPGSPVFGGFEPDIPASGMSMADLSRNPFPRTEADKKRIAEKALRIAEETLTQNKQQVIEFQKFNNAFINRQQALERIGAAENF